MEVLLESGSIENLVVGGAREVDEELVGGLGRLGGGGSLGGLHERSESGHTPISLLMNSKA